jgi:hypothetical protein
MTRVLIGILAAASFAAAQQTGASQEANTLQALLKEVHALRIALEQSNQIGPRIQIVLARIQLQEERVRIANRQLQDARDKVGDEKTRRATLEDRIKQFEAQQAHASDNNLRKQLEFDLTEMKAAVERSNVVEQQFRAREAEANSLLLTEQGRWNEANDALATIERLLAPRVP